MIPALHHSGRFVATIEVPNKYLELGPLVITSPTTRCGTTLVLRLVTNSSNAFVYGEEIGRQIINLTDQMLFVLKYCEDNEADLNAAFCLAMNGALTDWRPELAPPPEVMIKAWVETYYQLPNLLDAFGKAVGRPTWGFKWPGLSMAVASALFSLMPRARMIYLTRHPTAALKSAKARRFVRTDREADAFCAQWASNLDAFLALREDPRVLWLRYEDLIADKARALDRIAAFAGIEGMQMAEFDVKVNTGDGPVDDGFSSTRYIAPAELTGDDLRALRTHTAALIARLYPDLASAELSPRSV